jgi:hypothetical protein
MSAPSAVRADVRQAAMPSHPFRYLAPVRRRALGLVMLAVVACASGAARAGERPGFHGGGRGGMRAGGPFAGARAMRQERHMGPGRQGPMREPMREQPREQVPVAAPPVERPPDPVPVSRPGRLSPDERRALRQQINDAGRDIYRAPPR